MNMKRRTFLGLAAATPLLGRFVQKNTTVDEVAKSTISQVPQIIHRLKPSPVGFIQCVVNFKTEYNEDVKFYLVPNKWNGNIAHAQFLACIIANIPTFSFSFDGMPNHQIICQGEKPTFISLNIIEGILV